MATRDKSRPGLDAARQKARRLFPKWEHLRIETAAARHVLAPSAGEFGQGWNSYYDAHTAALLDLEALTLLGEEGMLGPYHLARARLRQGQGDGPGALRDLARALRVLPGDAELALEVERLAEARPELARQTGKLLAATRLAHRGGVGHLSVAQPVAALSLPGQDRMLVQRYQGGNRLHLLTRHGNYLGDHAFPELREVFCLTREADGLIWASDPLTPRVLALDPDLKRVRDFDLAELAGLSPNTDKMWHARCGEELFFTWPGGVSRETLVYAFNLADPRGTFRRVPTPRPVDSLLLFQAGGRLYLHDQPGNEVFRHDPATDAFTPHAVLPFPGTLRRVAAHGGDVFLNFDYKVLVKTGANLDRVAFARDLRGLLGKQALAVGLDVTFEKERLLYVADISGRIEWFAV